MKCNLPFAAAVVFGLFATCAADGHMEFECPDGWFLGFNKCYKIFHGDNKRTYTRAREVCESYGSRLVTIYDQLENDLIGREVSKVAGDDESFYIGLSKEKSDACAVCKELRWSNGDEATNYLGFWADDEPDESDGGCVFSRRTKSQRYVYERPYTWAYCNCLVIRSFVCEKMAAPEVTFSCFNGDYINENLKCDGNNDCQDGSDEFNCPGPERCQYYHNQESGTIGQLFYRNAKTCTWAIETPPGTDAFVQFNNFYTELQSDVVTIYTGSFSETEATRVESISGNIGTRLYRSYNNFIYVKFTTDSTVSNTGLITGFTGTYGAFKADTDKVYLTAIDTPRSYSVPTIDVSNINAFLGQRDYIIVVETENNYQFGQMITLQIENIQINDGDSVMFYDGDSPTDKLLATYCNEDDDKCVNYNVMYSTGRKLSILLRTQKIVSNNVVFRFTYRQGCYYETTETSGTIFTPGYTGNVDYTNFVKCTWKITVNEPIAIYFDSESRLQSVDHNRTNNGDFLKMYVDDVIVNGSSKYGLTTEDIAGQVFTPESGKIVLELDSSITRSSRGFLATWSTACTNPNYDEYTEVDPAPAKWHYRASMRLTCKQGYAFQQEQIPENTLSVNIECGFKGIWKNYRQIPRCTPKYCGDVPNIDNGQILSSTGSVFGSKALYKCNTGSAPQLGSLEIECLDTGVWSTRPVCSAARCPANQISETIINGIGNRTFGDGTSIGTIYEYQCNPGYEFVGEPYVFCQEENADWTQTTAPSCQLLTCLLPTIDNAIYSGTTTSGQFINVGRSVSVICKNGYEFATDSPTTITCGTDRNLSPLPQCVDKDECITTAPCQTNCENTVGSFRCSCDAGYYLAINGINCLDIDECTENTDNCDGGCRNIQGSYECTCNAPYVLYTGDMVSGYKIPETAGERGDLPTDTYHIGHSCVLVQCEAPPATIGNGQVLTKRRYHHYPDQIDFLCNVGYLPRRTTLTCGSSGQWDGTPPTCTAATCSREITGNVQTLPTYDSSLFYAYGRRLTLECNVAGETFNRYRFCTYNKDTDRYEMQGSSYECGVVDCGQPEQVPGSTYGSQPNTLFGASFTFTCEDNKVEGQTQAGSLSTVTCLKEGYWDFGDLRCASKKCDDPSYPAGGDIIATSFADKSTATFKCLRPGYSLSSDVTLTCQETNFFSGGETVPTCIDTQKPVFDNCPTEPIKIKRYQPLVEKLPRITVGDNTGILSFTVNPRNANTTFVVGTSNFQVVYTATDDAGNEEFCRIQVEIEDEEPPEITCPSRMEELESDSGTEVYTKLTMEEVVPFSQLDTIKTFQVNNEPGTLSITDLYKTFTYNVRVTDFADNEATCQGEIFIKAKACSELSFLTPLNAEKVCELNNNVRTCTLTCQDFYTFEDGKSKTIQCVNGNWNTEWIPACVLDQTAPVVRCPPSLTLDQLSKKDDVFEFDFTSLRNSVRITDLNDFKEPEFSVTEYTFTVADLYRPKVVTVSVMDSALNTGSCTFQYTVAPPICSELTLPTPQFGSVAGTRRLASFNRNAGWDVEITCNAGTGKILRNVGVSKTVSCDDGVAWSDDDIFPACIDDTKPPVLICPTAREEKIFTEDEVRLIPFADNQNYGHIETDYSGIKNVRFEPQTLRVDQTILNTAETIQMIVTDNANNVASCSFQVLIAAETCSPLALPAPVNGNKVCTQTLNGYSCTFTCNPNHSFYGTTESQVVTTCANNGPFSQYIPDCARNNDVRTKQYIARLQYEYIPADDAVLQVDPACVTYYKNAVAQTVNNQLSALERMAESLETLCRVQYGVDSEFMLTFLADNTEGRIINNRRVEMIYSYTMSYRNTSYYDICTESFKTDIAKPGNTLGLNRNIGGDGSCATLTWNDIAVVSDNGSYCAAPYFESLSNSNQCVRCPAGTQSNGVVCTLCPKGTYRTYDRSSCSLCPDGYTTRFSGTTSAGDCIAPCVGGSVSPTGYSPCFSCPVGSYRSSSTLCLECSSGQTTRSIGSDGPEDCIASSSVNDEPCTIGTEDIFGNNTCKPCALGTYRSFTVQQSCVSCTNSDSTSTYLRGAISGAQCIAKCSDGYTSLTGLAPCTPCPQGQYAASRTQCIPCPDGYTTVTDGASFCVEETTIRIKCPRGTSRQVNGTACIKCPEGLYNAAEESFCRPCEDSRTTTFFPGATASTMCRFKCPPGFFSDTGRAPCTACGIGSYSGDYGEKACSRCSLDNDMITKTTTSTNIFQCIEQCNEGSFSYNGYNQSSSSCRQCPRNYYQNQKGQTGCIQCDPNSRFSESAGLREASQCLLIPAERCDNYCQNGGVCVTRDNGPVCLCPAGQYHGTTCSEPVDHCASDPCYNGGICTSSPTTGFQCQCDNKIASGPRCETIIKQCNTTGDSVMCKNDGHCINRPGFTQCLCPLGFSGVDCLSQTDICTSSPCDEIGTLRCDDISRDHDLRRRCVCRPGYTGDTCKDDIDECASNPCINDGECENLQNAFRCRCPTGYAGTNCETRSNTCTRVSCTQFDVSASCADVYSIDQPTCICNPGYSYGAGGYTQYEIELNKGPDNLRELTAETATTVTDCRERCTASGVQCSIFAFDVDNNKCYVWQSQAQLSLGFFSNVNIYKKMVIYPEDDFYTPRYNLKTPSPTSPSDEELLATLQSYGLNICAGTTPLFTRCCRVNENCLDNEQLPIGATCTASGLRFPNTLTDYDVQFKCSVNRVFQNNVCSRKIDYCSTQSCLNGGACTDIFGGYTCTCANGYTGKNCQTNIDDCANSPCINGGTCEDLVGGYNCKCTDAYSGLNCASPKNFCDDVSCNNGGGCTNIRGVGYKCTCLLGYDGDLCENEINYCTSNPCQHGSTCERRVGGYSCKCVEGWRGTNCEAPVEHCSVLTTGRRCEGTCYNIFNGYSCKCDANTFGENCEDRPDPCGDYNKCQNDAACFYNGSMTCTCPTQYTGDGCQILVDYCGKTNPCQNGAACSVTSGGYECTCKPGYNGARCENEINECATVTCPGGGKCFDAINKYYCRCPIQKTGLNCQKDVDVNYDLYFNHPQGYGFAWIPYHIGVQNANFISLSLWVRYLKNADTGVYLTVFFGDNLEDAEKFFELEENGVKVYVPTDNANYLQLEYDHTARVNDGNWHIVTVLCDLVNGNVKLYLDTIRHDDKYNSALVMPAFSFHMLVVLGCEFDNEEHRCLEGGNSFQGFLSQVNFYKRELRFNAEPEGDISKNYRLPQYVFNDNIDDLILVWSEYETESGVGRMTPSEAHGAACNDTTRSPPCSSYRVTADLPSVTDCPDDIVLYSPERLLTVTWKEPSFFNLGKTGKVFRPSRLPGSSFSWGVYRNTYIGVDGNNNTAYCHFTIYINAAECDTPPNPYGGIQTCSTVSGRKGCMISCNNVNSDTYKIDRAHTDLFTCGPSGWWNQAKPFRPFRYPSCGLVKAVPKARVYIRVSYRIVTAAYTAARRNIVSRTFDAFINMDKEFEGDFCQNPDCSDMTVEVTLGPLQGQGKRKRRRRQTESHSQVLVEITLPSIDTRTMLDKEDVSSVDFLNYFILGDDVLVFSQAISGLVLLKDIFNIQMTEICPVGEVLRNGNCVVCGPGNYFRYTDDTNTTASAICDDCPLGSYQDEYSAMKCKPCSDGFTTKMTGENQQSACKKSCPIGEFFNTAVNVNDCEKCAIGYYQDEEGQFRCKGCPAGFITRDTGSTSSDQCKVSCDSGQELTSIGTCVPCPIGQYRDATELQQTCAPCPTGLITPGIATKTRAECNITACNPGNYLDVATNQCELCPLNQYQPDKWKTSCIPCGDALRWRTESEGSISQTQCKYFCPSGYQVKQDPDNRCEICPVGTYKDNDIDIQGTCIECTGNRRTETEGSTSSASCTIYKCPIGNKPNADNTDCVKCPLGYYQDEEYQTDCKKCADGYSTRQEESTSLGQCEKYCLSGQEKLGELCVPCKIGFYKNNIDGLFEPCKQCNSLFTTADTGSDNVIDCNIRTCPAGTKRNADDTGCEACPLGTYQSLAFQKDCETCDVGTSTRTVNATSKSDCETYCDSGYVKIGTECVGCGIGYYKDNVDGYFGECTLCPSEYITANNNSGSASLCVIANCTAGQYLRSDNTCELCPKGEYQSVKWQTKCIDCGSNKTTENVGSDELSDCILSCDPGFEDLAGTCKKCPRGTYKIETAAAKCKDCPPGSTTESTGAKNPALCILPACTAGQYLDKVTDPTNPVCKPCGYDSYQDQIWQERCETCPDNKVTLAEGGSELADCVLDCASGTQYNSTSDQCDFCAIGYFRNKDDRQQTQCQLCPIDKLTRQEGGKDISECDIANCTEAGYYRDTTTKSCEKCPVGKYNSEWWVTSCTDCPDGNSTRFTGSTSVNDCRSICPLGTFVGTNNNCEPCLVGTYRSNMATDSCTQCPDGFLTPEPGADSESDCSLTPCAAGEQYVEDSKTCVKCPRGYYQPNRGSLQCILCPFEIQYTPSEGSTSVNDCRSPCQVGQEFNSAASACVDCPVGTYQREPFKFSCTQCPVGRKFTEKGARKIEDCQSYCSAAAANDCSSNATCTVSDTNSLGYTCVCFTNFDSVSQVTGRECVHKCDRTYCKNGAQCIREPSPSCSCSKWLTGKFCESRLKGEDLSDDTLNIIIPVAIAAGGLILFLIILAVCCLCWRRGKAIDGPHTQYSEFQGERIEKSSLPSHEFTMPYASRPPSRLMMLAPGPDMVLDNQLYTTKDHSVLDGSVLETAVYEA